MIGRCKLVRDNFNWHIIFIDESGLWHRLPSLTRKQKVWYLIKCLFKKVNYNELIDRVYYRKLKEE